MKFDSPSKFSKIRKSMTSLDATSKLVPGRERRRSASKGSIDMELLTSLPVPTVPPYPIEYFQDSGTGTSHVNMAFNFEDEPIYQTNSNNTNALSSTASGYGDFKQVDDSDSKVSSDGSRESIGASTVDSGIGMNSNRSSSNRQQVFHNNPPITPNNHPDQFSYHANANNIGRTPPRYSALYKSLGYTTYPIRHNGTQSSSAAHQSQNHINYENPYSNTNNENNVRLQWDRNYSTMDNVNSERDFIAPVHATDVTRSNLPQNIKEKHIYANAPPTTVSREANIPQQALNFQSQQLNNQKQRAIQPRKITHYTRHSGQSGQHRPCGRSQSVNDEARRTDHIRSRLGSINTLGIPYQTTLPSKHHVKQPVPTHSSQALYRTKAIVPKKVTSPPNTLSNKGKSHPQAKSSSKKLAVPVYSKVCKPKNNQKKLVPNTTSDSIGSRLLKNPKGIVSTYNSITSKKSKTKLPKKGNTSSKINNTKVESDAVDGVINNLKCDSNGEDENDGPIYDRLLELDDDDECDTNGQYSIEVRIDYSKGTKYKVEKRRRRHSDAGECQRNQTMSEQDFNCDSKDTPQTSTLKTKCDMKLLKEKFAEPKASFFSYCCCG